MKWAWQIIEIILANYEMALANYEMGMKWAWQIMTWK